MATAIIIAKAAYSEWGKKGEPVRLVPAVTASITANPHEPVVGLGLPETG